MTFGFTVTALLRLVDEGRLALDDPISRFSLPVPVRDGDRITVRDLMAMRSGLSDVRDEPGYTRAAAHPATAADRLRLVALACDRPLRFAPGTRFEDSGTNGLLLGMILERLTGESPTRWIATQLFRPLRLAATSFPTATALPRSAAHGYAVGARDWFDVSAATQPALAWTAGGIVSSASDIRRWLDASIGGRLTAASTQRARIACRPTGEPGIGYGLGLRCAGGWLGASGYAAGYSTAAYKLQSHTRSSSPSSRRSPIGPRPGSRTRSYATSRGSSRRGRCPSRARRRRAKPASGAARVSDVRPPRHRSRAFDARSVPSRRRPRSDGLPPFPQRRALPRSRASERAWRPWCPRSRRVHSRAVSSRSPTAQPSGSSGRPRARRSPTSFACGRAIRRSRVTDRCARIPAARRLASSSSTISRPAAASTRSARGRAHADRSLG